MAALLFGSISTLADTSELQRAAFNQAFADHGLDWRWDREDYRGMLEKSGGAARIAEYAAERGQTVDAAAVHRNKSAHFQENVRTTDLTTREGVLDVLHAARQAGWKLGLVTTTSRDNITALLGALGPDLSEDSFDVIVDGSQVTNPKPDATAYSFALDQLGQRPENCVAIEDNVEGAEAALAAHLPCVAFPNQNTAGHEFPSSAIHADRLDTDTLRKMPAAG